MSNTLTSRRTLLATMSGVVTANGHLLRAASPGHRVLVGIRLADGRDAQGIQIGSLPDSGIHESLPHIRRQFELGAAEVSEEPVGRRGYLPEGFVAPAWMLQAASASLLDTANRAWTFSGGLVMLTPDGIALDGPCRDNPALVSRTGETRFAFPATYLGKQLRQVVSLLATGTGERMMFSATLAGATSLLTVEAGRPDRMKEMDEAVGAFNTALGHLGIASDVTIFTYADPAGIRKAARLVLGGAVADRGTVGPTIDVRRWAGYSNFAVGLVN